MPKNKHRYKMLEQIDGSLNRISKIAEIKENVIDFVMDVLSELELEVIPDLSVDRIVGFEQPKPIKDIRGYILVNAFLNTLSGKFVRLTIPIPMYNGEFLRPSILGVGNNKTVFSKSAIHKLIDKYKTFKPTVEYMYGANPAYSREEVVGRGEFASFPAPIEWDEPLFNFRG